MWYRDRMEKTTLYLPTELQRNLRDLSRRTGRPQAELIREALSAYVTKEGRPWPKSIGSAANGTVAGRDSEAWIREQWSRREARPLRRTRRA
jgi:predicted transcriptional regulator